MAPAVLRSLAHDAKTGLKSCRMANGGMFRFPVEGREARQRDGSADSQGKAYCLALI